MSSFRTLLLLFSLFAPVGLFAQDGEPATPAEKTELCRKRLESLAVACFGYAEKFGFLPPGDRPADPEHRVRAHEALQELVRQGFLCDPAAFVCPFHGVAPASLPENVDAVDRFELKAEELSFGYNPNRLTAEVEAATPILWDRFAHEGGRHVVLGDRRVVLVPEAEFAGLMAEAKVPDRAWKEPDFESLSWMAGTWRAETEQGVNEETWLGPAGNLMIGASRSVAPGGLQSTYEYLRIENRKSGVVYVASPRGQAPTEFALTGGGPRQAVFENPAHDFPQRITYWIPADGGLAARVEARSGDGWEGFEIRWARAE